MPVGPMLLISKSVRALLPYWHGPLGQLFTPRLLTSLDITEGCGIQWAADNDCFNGFDPWPLPRPDGGHQLSVRLPGTDGNLAPIELHRLGAVILEGCLCTRAGQDASVVSEHRWVDSWEKPFSSVWLAAMAELDDPVVVELPLRGEWSVERTPASRIPSHGTDLLGQRYAYDLVRTDHRPGFHLHPAGTLRWLLIGGRTRDCYGWGQPVHAAFDGVIVQAVDGVPERQWLHVVRESWLALNNTLAFARRGLDPVRLAGNHVIVGAGGTYALYAHLAPGSVAVTGGQQVRAGEVIGRVGHTGNSTAPHLHFQLMGSADPFQARGIPCAFAAYLVERDGRWQRVERGIPHRRQRICSVS